MLIHPSLGMIRLIEVGWLMVVVKIKNVMSRKPKSTIGVISMRRLSFFVLPNPDLGLLLGWLEIISAMAICFL